MLVGTVLPCVSPTVRRAVAARGEPRAPHRLKLGLTDGPQLGVFGAGYLRTSGGTGVGDLGVGGVVGLTAESPDQLFVGVTTNVGRIFK